MSNNPFIQEYEPQAWRTSRGRGYGQNLRRPSQAPVNMNWRIGSGTVKKMKYNIKSDKKMTKVERDLKKLKRQTNATLGTMNYRALNTDKLLCAENAIDSDVYGSFGVAGIEYALQYLKFFNPANPGTLTTASIAGVTYQNNVLLSKVSSQIYVRNNYQNDALVSIYLCKVKDDTNQSAQASWVAGYPDGGNASAVTNQLQYPTDYNTFNDLWTAKRVVHKTLKPGQEAKYTHSEKNIEYSTSTVDTHALEYQKEYKAFEYLVMINGRLCHDSTSAVQQGFGLAGIDVATRLSIQVKYPAGINIEYIHIVDNSTSMTTQGLQSQKPVSDNQAFSIT